MQLVLDLVLIGLLAVASFIALRLHRQLAAVRTDRAAFERTVGEFQRATGQAEAGMERLRVVADGTAQRMARLLDEARVLKDDLAFLTERGGRLADRLEAATRPGRAASAALGDPPPEPGRLDATRFEPARADPAHPPPARGEMPRSQAERDLIMALRSAR
jgi:hypothetical protein